MTKYYYKNCCLTDLLLIGELGEPCHQHVQQGAVLVGFHLKAHDFTNLHANEFVLTSAYWILQI